MYSLILNEIPTTYFGCFAVGFPSEKYIPVAVDFSEGLDGGRAQLHAVEEELHLVVGHAELYLVPVCIEQLEKQFLTEFYQAAIIDTEPRCLCEDPQFVCV